MHLIGIFPIIVYKYDIMELRKVAKGFGDAPFSRHLIFEILKDDKALQIWSPTYFSDLIEKLKFV